MNRRHFLAAGLATLAVPTTASSAESAPAPATIRTRWTIRGSEGFDALSFLSPLSGDEFYQSHYRDEVAAFLPRLAPETVAAIRSIKAELATSGTLLSPWLDVIFSSGNDRDIPALVRAIDEAETRLRPPYLASSYGNEANWGRFLAIKDRLRMILEEMGRVGFAALRHDLFAPVAARRLPEIQAYLSRFDVTAEQQRMTGRAFDPEIALVILHFSKPHGIKVQGQQFLAAADYSNELLAFIAAHEMLHPPIPEDGVAARSAVALLERDPLIARIVAEHDPSFGYNSAAGLFNEDLTQALDQMICERLGIPRPSPTVRWTRSDGGMHVLAAAFYGLLRRDGWHQRGGNIEAWMAQTVRSGWLTPDSIASSASAVLGRPRHRLWPPPPAQPAAQ